jgi:hypothetical protein
MPRFGKVEKEGRVISQKRNARRQAAQAVIQTASRSRLAKGANDTAPQGRFHPVKTWSLAEATSDSRASSYFSQRRLGFSPVLFAAHKSFLGPAE